MSYSSIYRSELFAGQAFLITGGGSGIGRCTAHELAALGASVALVGRNAEKLERVKQEIGEAGGRVTVHVGDIRDEERVAGIVGEVLDVHGRIDGLFNNAGGQYRSAVQDISTKGFTAVLQNNLVGGFQVMREVFNRSMQAHGGAIVNMIMDVSHGMPNYAHSAAARGGMATLTETAGCEWAPYGVRVNAVCPGFIASSGLDHYSEEHARSIPDHVTKVPMQRFGTEAEVSAVVVFLLSPAAAYVTGSIYRVDGGSPNARQTATLIPALRSNVYEGFHLAHAPQLLRTATQGQ
ncbi:MAG TPA: SDR family oxidoreductase [Ramlibacter sp.]|nr:SDR family oxidoreductase [Ramlibacter sp.]